MEITTDMMLVKKKKLLQWLLKFLFEIFHLVYTFSLYFKVLEYSAKN